jgi:hypothetical protein
MHSQQPPRRRGPYQQPPGGPYQQPQWERPPGGSSQPPWETPPDGSYQQPRWEPTPGGPYRPQTGGPYQPPPRKRRLGLKITLGIVGGIIVLIIVGAVLGGNKGGTGTGASTGTGTGSSPAAQSGGSSVAHIGDKVRDGKFEFTVIKVTHAKSVVDTSLGLGDTAQGRYTIVTLKVTNIGNQSQTLDDSAQYAYDASGRKYSASSSADIDLSGANGQGNTWLDDINPGNTVRGKIAFDMPTGVKAVKIELHDSMFSDGVIVHLN